MKTVTIYTDGACKGNPGPGGWAAVLKLGDVEKEISGGEPSTTNNRMELTAVISDIQKEIRRNKNTGAEKIVSLEDLLKKIFVELEYIDLNNLSEVNGKLLKILEDLRYINEGNERLAARYGGNYAFVKTYSDVAEMHPEFDKEDLAKLTDVAYAAVKDIEGSNILILHGRESFVNTVKKNTTTQLLKSGLYKKLNLKDWYADFLGETYSNMRIF